MPSSLADRAAAGLDRAGKSEIQQHDGTVSIELTQGLQNKICIGQLNKRDAGAEPLRRIAILERIFGIAANG